MSLEQRPSGYPHARYTLTFGTPSSFSGHRKPCAVGLYAEPQPAMSRLEREAWKANGLRPSASSADANQKAFSREKFNT
ncbi:hypothetical protein J1614_007358 [Plenodomus biglobosus]|nr:hypothetical protein J1614_007358 [Plenodomus biglobosus]